MTQHQRKIWMKWFIIVGGWTLFGLYMAAQYYVYGARSGRPASWEVLLISELSYALLWAAFTPLVLWLAERFRVERNTWARHIPIHVVASVGVASTQKILSGMVLAFYEISNGAAFSWEAQFQNLLAVIDYGILLYWLILLIHYSIEYYRRYQERALRAAQLETQLAQAQFQALRMQLHPHFLFNTLNAISVLIKKDPDLARRTVGRLSDLLRLTLENGAVQEVSLKTELEFLDRYLEIEQTRFGDRLKVSFCVDPEMLDVRVPNLIFQPLVENAIKHGINKKRGRGFIEIHAEPQNGRLELRVLDNGRGLPAGNTGDVAEGVGITNTRARLQQIYGDEFVFELSNVRSGGLSARIVIPLHMGNGTIEREAG